MKLIRELGLKSNNYRRKELSPGEWIVGSGDGKGTYPIYKGHGKSIEKSKLEDRGYEEYSNRIDSWNKRRESDFYEKQSKEERKRDSGKFSVNLEDTEICKQGIYEARVKILGASGGGKARDKIRFVDVDTGAYYVMTTDDLIIMLNKFAEGKVQFDKGIYTFECYPEARGGTCFLIVNNSLIQEKVEKVKVEKERKYLPGKEVVFGGEYDGFIYLGKGLVTEKNYERNYGDSEREERVENSGYLRVKVYDWGVSRSLVTQSKPRFYEKTQQYTKEQIIERLKDYRYSISIESQGIFIDNRNSKL